MNKVFKVIWCQATQTWVAASEFSRAKGKSKTKSVKTAVASALLLTAGGASAASVVNNDNSITGVANGDTKEVVVYGKDINVGGGTQTDNTLVGSNITTHNNAQKNTVVGNHIVANTVEGTLIGHNVSAAGTGTVGIGKDVNATQTAVAVGTNVTTKSNKSVAIGHNVNVSAYQGSVAIGYNIDNQAGVDATPDSSGKTKVPRPHVMIGNGIKGRGNGSITISTQGDWLAEGSDHQQTWNHGNDSIAIGANVHIGEEDQPRAGMPLGAVAIGSDARIGSGTTYTVSIGDNAAVYGSQSSAVGRAAIAYSVDSIAMGHQAVAGSGTQANGTSKYAYKDKAENVTGNYATSIGAYSRASHEDSSAFGRNSSATANQATALGTYAKSSELKATSVGYKAYSLANSSSSLGSHSATYADLSIAIGGGAREGVDGNSAIAMAEKAIAIGSGARSGANSSIAIGDGAQIFDRNEFNQGWNSPYPGIGNDQSGFVRHGREVTFTNAMAIGSNTRALERSAIAFGHNAKSTGIQAFAGGYNASTTAEDALALGSFSKATAQSAVAVGNTSTASAENAIAMGTNSLSNAASTVAISTNSFAGGENAIAIGKDSYAAGKKLEDLNKDVTDTLNQELTEEKHDKIKQALEKAKTNSADTAYQAMIDKILADLKKGTGEQNAQGPLWNGKKALEFVKAAVSTATVPLNSAIAIGDSSKSIAEKSITLGYGNLASGVQSVAIGTDNIVKGNYSTTVGDPSIIEGTASHAQGNDNVISSATTGALVLGNRNRMGAKPTYTGGEGGDINTVKVDKSKALAGVISLDNTAESLLDVSGSVAIGNDNTVTSKNTFILGNSVNTINNLTTGKGTVANSVYLGSNSTAVAGAPTTVGELKNIKDDGTPGVSTTGGDKGVVNTATVAGVDYQGFQGSKADGVVTVGSADAERRIQNVAAGEISSTSTDAINGSQLYMVVKAVGDVSDNIPFSYTVKEGDQNVPVTSIDGKFYKDKDLDGLRYDPATKAFYDATTGDPATAPTEVAADKINVSSNVDDTNSPDTLNNIKGSLPQTLNEGDKAQNANTTPNPNGVAATGDTFTKAQTAPADIAPIYNNAATVGDVLNAGWNLQGDGAEVDFVKPYDTVNFIDTNTTNITVESADGKTSTIKVDVITTKLTNSDGEVDTPQGVDSNKLVNAEAVAEAINNSGWLVSVGHNDDDFEDEEAYSVDGDADLITMGETATFMSGKNIKVGQNGANITYATLDDVEFNSVQLGKDKEGPKLTVDANNNIKVGDKDGAPVKITNVADGEISPTSKDAINGSQLDAIVKDSYWTVKEKGTEKDQVKAKDVVDFVDGLGTTVSVENTDGVTSTIKYDVAFGDISANPNTGAVTSTDANSDKVASTKDVAEAISDSGWKLKDANGKETIVNPSDSVTFKDSNTLTATVNVDDLNNPTVTFEAKTAELTADQAKPGSITAPSQDDAAKLVNATTVATAINNSGWNVDIGREANEITDQEGVGKKLVNPGEDVTFKAGKNLVVKKSTGDDAHEIAFATAKDVDFNSVQLGYDGTGPKLQKGDDGSIKVSDKDGDNPVNITNLKGNLDPAYNDGDLKEEDGKLNVNTPAEAGDITKAQAGPGTAKAGEIYNNAATVGDVLNAGWNLQGNGKAVDFVKPYDTVNFVNGIGTTVVAESADGKTSTIKINTLTQYTTEDGTPVTVIDGKGYPVGSIKAQNGNVYPAGTELGEDGNPKNPAAGTENVLTDAPQISLVDVNGVSKQPTVLGNVAAGTKTLDGSHRGDKADADTPTVIDPARTQLAEAYKGLADLNNSNDNNALTVADAKNLGWVVSSDKTTGDLGTEYADDVRNANEVRFVGTGLATVSGKTEDGVRTITVDVKAQNSQQPVVYTDKDGNKVIKAADGKFYPADSVVAADGKVYPAGTALDASGKPQDQTATPRDDGKDAGDVIASMNDGDNSTTTPMSLANVKGTLAATYNAGNPTVTDGKANKDAPVADATKQMVNPFDKDSTTPATAEELANVYNNAATVGDVLNAGWNLQENSEARDFVKPYDTVNFVNGQGTTVKIATSDDGRVSNVRIDTLATLVDKDGNPLIQIGENFYKASDIDPKTGQPKVDNGDVAQPVDQAANGPFNVNISNPTAKDAETTTPIQVGNVAAGANTYAANKGSDEKTPLVKVGDSYYTPDDFENGKLKPTATPADYNAATALNNPAATAREGLADLNNSNPTNVMTVADAKNLGWVVSSDKKTTQLDQPYADDVRNADEVRFVGTGLATVSGATEDNVRIITVDVKAQQQPVVYTDAAGNKLIKGDDGKFYPADSVNIGGKYYPAGTTADNVATATPATATEPKDVIASMNDGDDSTTAPMNLANVKGNLPQTVNTGDKKEKDDGSKTLGDELAAAPTQRQEAPTNVADIYNNAATVGDVLNAGWNLSVNGDSQVDFVKPYDTVNFNNGKGTIASVENKDGKVSNVTFNIDNGEAKALENGALQGTSPEDKADLEKAVKDAEAEVVKADEAVKAKETELADAQKALAAAPDDQAAKDKVAEAEKALADAQAEKANKDSLKAKADRDLVAVDNKVATVENLVTAVNNSGFNIFQDDNTADNHKALVNPSDNVVFRAAGDANVNVTKEKDGTTNITYRVDLPVIYTDKDGNKLVKGEDGKFYNPTELADKEFIDGKYYPKGSVVAKDGKVYPKGTQLQADGNAQPGTQEQAETAPTETPKDNVITSINSLDKDGKAKDPMVLSNVAPGVNTIGDQTGDDGKPLVKVGDKYYKAGDLTNGVPNPNAAPVDNGTAINKADAPIDAAKAGLADLANSNPTNVMTVADAKNLGWVVSTSKAADKFAAPVTNAQVVDFVGDAGVEVTGKTDQDGKHVITIGLSEAGKLQAEEAKNNPGATAATTTGKVEVAPNIAGDETSKKPNGFVSAESVANAINASGFNIKASAAEGKLEDGTAEKADPAATETKNELINPGDVVEMVAGKNLVVKHDKEGKITYSLNKDINVNSVTVETADPNNPDKKASPITMVSVPSDVPGEENSLAFIAPKKEGDKIVGTAPVTIKNINGSLPVTYNQGDNEIIEGRPTGNKITDVKSVNAEQPAPSADEIAKIYNNAATVGDVLNAGWNLQGNGEAKDFVKPYDTVNFVNGVGTTVTVEAAEDGKSSTIKVDVAKGEVTPNADGSVSGPATKELLDKLKEAEKAVADAQKAVADAQKALAENKDPAKEAELKQAVEDAKAKAADPALEKAVAEAKDAIAKDPSGNGLVTAKNVADAINNSGWKVTSGEDGGKTTGTTEELINPSETVTFKSGKNIELKQDGNNFTYSLAKDINVNSVTVETEGPNGKGSPITMVSSPNNTLTLVAPQKDENGDVTGVAPVTVNGIKGNLDPTYNAGDIKQGDDGKLTTEAADAPTKSQTAPSAEEAAKMHNNAATVGDVLNAGWNLQGNGEAKDFVKPYDTVNFVNGEGTTATVITNPDGKSSDIVYSVNVDGKTTEITYTNAAGETIYKLADGTYNTQKDGKGNKVEAKDITGSRVSAILPTTSVGGKQVGGDINFGDSETASVTTNDAGDIIVNVNTGDITNNDNGSVAGPEVAAQKALDEAKKALTELPNTATPEEKKAAEDAVAAAQKAVDNAPNQVATAKNVADAINNSGFTLTAQDQNGSVVNPGETVDMKNEDGNIVISKSADNNDVVYNLARDINVDSVQFGEDGPKVQKGADGSIKVGDKDDAPVAITNVAGNLQGAKKDTTAPTTKADAPVDADAISNNAATVGDVLNAGWNLQGNGEAKDFVKPYDTVNFVNGAGTKVSVDSDGKISTIKVDIDLANITTNLTVSDGEAGDTDGSTTVGDAGKVVVSPNAEDKLIKAADVAHAINASGWVVTSDKEDGGTLSGTQSKELINPGEAVTFKSGKNIDLKQEGNNFTYSLAKDIDVNSVNAGKVTADEVKVGDVIINNAGINAGNKVISNVANGVAPTDAVNVGQLNGVVNNINNRINDIDDNYRAGIAGSAALVNIPQVTRPGANLLGVGLGHFKGESAIAVGFSSASDNERLIFKISGSANTQGDYSIGSGMGWQW